MPARSFYVRAATSLACVLGLAGAAVAADNSGIVIIDQQHRATPLGSYDSHRRTQAFGPTSGFRYEQYRTPIRPVYPRYRHNYGNRYHGYRHGRVIERPGVNGYGRYGAPAAPRIHVYGRYDRRGPGFGRRGVERRDHHARDTDDRSTRRWDTGRAIDPAERAIESGGRVIDTR